MTFLKIRENPLIYDYKAKIIQRIEKSQVVVIEGETGNQIPHWCLEVSNVSRVVCTQPRRIAAINLAKRVSHEMRVSLGGDDVGYVVRFENKTSLSTSLKYMTESTLLRQIMTDRYLNSYDVIVIDEVHERRMVTDILIGVIKGILPCRPDLKVNICKFRDFFKNCDSFKVPGKIHPIETKFWDEVIERVKFPEDDAKHFEQYVIRAINVVMEICITEREGDILVFVTGRDEIDYICGLLEKLVIDPTYSQHLGQIDVIPLYGELPYSSQQRIFADSPSSSGGKISRKCIIATNIAETSITIEGIDFVVDSGKVKMSLLLQKYYMYYMMPVEISKSSAYQRACCAGKTQPGKCYRLYTLKEYNAMPEDTVPEILRCDLVSEILRLILIGIDIEKFDYIDKPHSASLQLALDRLKQLNAIDDCNQITLIGRQMAKFPLDAEVARMLVASKEYSCQSEILILASMLSGNRPGNVFVGKTTGCIFQPDKDEFTHPSGDHLTYIKVFTQYTFHGCSEGWCFDNKLNFKILSNAKTIYDQLKRIMLELKLMGSQCCNKAEDSNILKAIVAGNICQMAQYGILPFGSGAKQQYITVWGNNSVALHPSCCLSSTSGSYPLLTYSTCMKTNTKHCYISTVSVIEKGLYQEVASAIGAPPLPEIDFTIKLDWIKD